MKTIISSKNNVYRVIFEQSFACNHSRNNGIPFPDLCNYHPKNMDYDEAQ